MRILPGLGIILIGFAQAVHAREWLPRFEDKFSPKFEKYCIATPSTFEKSATEDFAAAAVEEYKVKAKGRDVAERLHRSLAAHAAEVQLEKMRCINQFIPYDDYGHRVALNQLAIYMGAQRRELENLKARPSCKRGNFNLEIECIKQLNIKYVQTFALVSAIEEFLDRYQSLSKTGREIHMPALADSLHRAMQRRVEILKKNPVIHVESDPPLAAR